MMRSLFTVALLVIFASPAVGADPDALPVDCARGTASDGIRRVLGLAFFGLTSDSMANLVEQELNSRPSVARGTPAWLQALKAIKIESVDNSLFYFNLIGRILHYTDSPKGTNGDDLGRILKIRQLDLQSGDVIAHMQQMLQSTVKNLETEAHRSQYTWWSKKLVEKIPQAGFVGLPVSVDASVFSIAQPMRLALAYSEMNALDSSKITAFVNQPSQTAVAAMVTGVMPYLSRIDLELLRTALTSRGGFDRLLVRINQEIAELEHEREVSQQPLLESERRLAERQFANSVEQAGVADTMAAARLLPVVDAVGREADAEAASELADRIRQMDEQRTRLLARLRGAERTRDALLLNQRNQLGSIAPSPEGLSASQLDLFDRLRDEPSSPAPKISSRRMTDIERTQWWLRMQNEIQNLEEPVEARALGLLPGTSDTYVTFEDFNYMVEQFFSEYAERLETSNEGAALNAMVTLFVSAAESISKYPLGVEGGVLDAGLEKVEDVRGYFQPGETFNVRDLDLLSASPLFIVALNRRAKAIDPAATAWGMENGAPTMNEELNGIFALSAELYELRLRREIRGLTEAEGGKAHASDVAKAVTTIGGRRSPEGLVQPPGGVAIAAVIKAAGLAPWETSEETGEAESQLTNDDYGSTASSDDDGGDEDDDEDEEDFDDEDDDDEESSENSAAQALCTAIEQQDFELSYQILKGLLRGLLARDRGIPEALIQKWLVDAGRLISRIENETEDVDAAKIAELRKLLQSPKWEKLAIAERVNGGAVSAPIESELSPKDHLRQMLPVEGQYERALARWEAMQVDRRKIVALFRQIQDIDGNVIFSEESHDVLKDLVGRTMVRYTPAEFFWLWRVNFLDEIGYDEGDRDVWRGVVVSWMRLVLKSSCYDGAARLTLYRMTIESFVDESVFEEQEQEPVEEDELALYAAVIEALTSFGEVLAPATPLVVSDSVADAVADKLLTFANNLEAMIGEFDQPRADHLRSIVANLRDTATARELNGLVAPSLAQNQRTIDDLQRRIDDIEIELAWLRRDADARLNRAQQDSNAGNRSVP